VEYIGVPVALVGWRSVAAFTAIQLSSLIGAPSWFAGSSFLIQIVPSISNFVVSFVLHVPLFFPAGPFRAQPFFSEHSRFLQSIAAVAPTSPLSPWVSCCSFWFLSLFFVFRSS
jgi:hypothetical protein